VTAYFCDGQQTTIAEKKINRAASGQSRSSSSPAKIGGQQRLKKIQDEDSHLELEFSIIMEDSQ
jgi:hypothetical protein